jgi:hypothetical protein
VLALIPVPVSRCVCVLGGGGLGARTAEEGAGEIVDCVCAGEERQQAPLLQRVLEHRLLWLARRLCTTPTTQVQDAHCMRQCVYAICAHTTSISLCVFLRVCVSTCVCVCVCVCVCHRCEYAHPKLAPDSRVADGDGEGRLEVLCTHGGDADAADRQSAQRRAKPLRHPTPTQTTDRVRLWQTRTPFT